MKLRASFAGTSLALIASQARAADAWSDRLDAARLEASRGRCEAIGAPLDDLVQTAKDDVDRALARALRDHCAARSTAPRRALRSREELAFLYGNAFVYGLGTASWFVLEVQPTVSLAAMIPFAGFTLGSVGAVATIDRVAPFPAGVPQAIGSGLYLGLGEGVFLVGYQHARADRIAQATGHDPRWSTEESATVLWMMSSVGVATGALLGYGRTPTSGRVAFTASTTLWGGALASAATGALMPYGGRRLEDTFLVGAAGYDAGLLAGMVLAPRLAPSVARMRLVDLVGAAGGIATAGVYALAAQSNVDARTAWGLGALGSATGLVAGWVLTGDMAPAQSAPTSTAWSWSIAPSPSGATVRLGGAL